MEVRPACKKMLRLGEGERIDQSICSTNSTTQGPEQIAGEAESPVKSHSQKGPVRGPQAALLIPHRSTSYSSHPTTTSKWWRAHTSELPVLWIDGSRWHSPWYFLNSHVSFKWNLQSTFIEFLLGVRCNVRTWNSQIISLLELSWFHAKERDGQTGFMFTQFFYRMPSLHQTYATKKRGNSTYIGRVRQWQEVSQRR